jgi:hypothetical protein
VQALPDRWRQVGEPEIVAGGGHEEENDERDQAQWLERKPRQLTPASVRGQDADQRVDDSQGVELDDREATMGESEGEHRHAEMAAVVEQRQEAPIEPRQRPDREDDVQQQHRRGTESTDEERLDRHLWRQGRAGRNEQRQIDHDGGEQGQVVEPLLPVPSDGPIGVAHGALTRADQGVDATSSPWPRL